MAAPHDMPGGRTRRRGGIAGVVMGMLLLLSANVAHGQIVRTFAQRYSTSANGTVQIIGNALMTCPTSNASCAAARNGTGGTVDNNSFSMVDIDIDSDAATQNSSSATFTLPAGGSVLFAGLYWGARSNAATRNQVRFSTPASGGYSTITATQLDANNPAYQGFANVTALVQAGGSGTYTVANVQRTTGTDQYAGWALVIVVRDPVELRRNLVVFDGYGTVQSSATTVTIPVSGFLTPTSGAVNAQLGVVAYEGDLGQTGDVLRLNATNLTDATNPSNNVFNSTISRLGSAITAKNPNYVNQIGFDADVINASGILANGSTSATITLTTGGETYYPGVVTLATQLYVPDLTTTFTKTVTDVNGGTIQRGDTLEYLISFTNTGQDTATAVVVTDTIPAGTTYVPGSISYVTSVPSGPPTGSKTDLPGDDAANYEAGPNRVLARLGIGATASAGGRLGPGQGSSFRFRVVINPALSAGTLVSNQAAIDYVGQTLGDLFNGRSDGDAGTPGIQATVVAVAPAADVQVGKAGPATGTIATSLSYTVTVTNVGPDAATSVVVRDTLPASFTFVSATGGGTASGNVVTWPTIASLANGGSQSFTVTATPTATGSFTNIAAATAATFDSSAANSNGSAPGSRVTTVIAGAADVAVTKSGPVTINAGSPLTYSVTVSNAGPSAATGVVLTDTLPAGVTFVSATGGGTLSGSVVTWPALASLASGGNAAFSVTVTPPATGTLLNIAAATTTSVDPVPGNNNGSAAASRVTTTVIEQANLAVTKSGPATVNAGQAFTYTVTATNAGPSAAAGVIVMDTLPASVTFVSATGGGTLSGNVVTWPATTMASGASASYTVSVTAPPSGTLLNIAAGTTATADPDASNNNGSLPAARVTTNVVPQADLAVAKSGPASALVSSTQTYSITVSNAGPSAASGVVVTDTLPASVTFVSATGGATVSGRVVTWPAIASLAAGSSQGYSVTVTMPATAQTVLNLAAASSGTADPDLSNNDGSASGSRVSTLVTASADVRTGKSGPATVNAGQNATYTVTVSNAGPSAAANVVLTDTLPASATFVSATGGGTRVGNVVTWPVIASLANGASQSFTVVVTAPVTGTMVNLAAAASPTPDPLPGNNDGSDPASRATTVVAELANLAVTKTGPATVVAGGSITYTIRASNAGPSPAANVVVTDTLPATATFVSASAGGTLSGNVVAWPAIASVASGANQVFTVTVTAPGSGPLLNIAAGTSTTPDPVPGNNNGSAAGARVTTAVTASADVQMTKTGPASVNAGTTYAYTVTVTNAGPSAAASVIVRDTLPATGTFVSMTGGGTRAGRLITWPTIASLAAGASQSFTVTWTAPVNPAVPLTLTNMAYSTSTTPDPVPGNNSNTNPAAIVNTAVVATADVATTKTGPATVNGSTNYSYTITTRNNGPSTATGLVISDTLPATVIFVSATNGGVLGAGNVVTWPAITLNSATTTTRTVTVTSPPSGTLLNIAASTATTFDPNTADNNGSAAGARVTTVVNSADVATTKTGPATVNGAANYTYTITIRNNGPGAATGIAVVDTLPATVTFVSATNGGTLGAGNVVTWPAFGLANAATTTRSVTVTAPPSGTLLNIAASTSTSADPVPGNNDGSAAGARVATTVNTADVVTTKAGPATVNAGASMTYTLTVRNAGAGVATGIVLTDTLPATVTFVSASNGGTASGNVVSWPAIATLANGATTTRTVVVTAPTSGTLLNIAASTSTSVDPTPANNDGSAAGARVTTTVLVADVATTKTGPATVNGSANYSYTITVRNNGPTAAPNIIVTDTLPATVTFVSASNGGTLGAGNVITWPVIATLANGATTTRTVTVTAPATGTLLNIVASTSGTTDPDPTNNNGSLPAARVTTSINAADLVTTKTGPATANPGGSITYTLTTRNQGPNAAPTVIIRDTLPAGVTFVSASNGGTFAGGVVTWPSIASLANGASTTRTVTVTAPAMGTLLNIAASSSATTDPDPSNNNGSLPAARVTTTINATDVVTTKTGPATATIGSSISYTITVRNAGAAQAMGVVVTDTLPAGLTFVSASGGGTAAGSVVTWPAVATLAAGASQTYTVTAGIPIAGSFTNIVASTAASADNNPANNNGSLPAARVTTVVLNSADVVTTKSGPATVNAAQAVTYTITVSNNGPTAAANVVASDTLPAAAAFVSASAGGTLSGNVVTWPAIASLANGATQSYTVTVTAPPSGTLLDIAASTATTPDPVPGNNNGSLPASRVTTTVVEQADVATTKTGPASVNAGQNFNYTLTVANAGPSSAAGVVVTDTLPAGVTFVSASGGGSASGNVVTWPAIASLASGASQGYTVTVTAPATGTLLNIAASTSSTADPDPSNNNGSQPGSRVTTTVVEQADVATTKSGPASVNAGQSFSYTLTVANAGPSSAAAVLVTDTLPSGVAFVSATGGGSVSGNVVSWPAIASLASGASQGYTVTVTAPAAGTLLNIAASTSTTVDPDPANNNGSQPGSRVTTTVVEQADVATTKTGPATVNAAQNFSYAISVVNNGPSAAAAVVVTDTLPAGVTFVSATAGGTLSGNVVTWPAIASLASGASQGYGVTVTAPASGTLLNIAASRSVTADPDPANNNGSQPGARVTTTVIEQADVATTKTGPATVNAAQNFSYAIAVVNNGPSAAGNVVVMDTLPAGVTFVSATGGGSLTGNVVTWPAIASLASGANQGYSVTVTAPASGVLTNVVASTSSTGDPDPANNNGSSPASRVTTTVIEQADVATTKTGPVTVNAGQNFSYALGVTNAGPSAAANVVVTDTLPAGVIFVSATNGGTLSGNVVTWPAIASLASGASQSYGVTVTAPATGTITNLLASSSTTADPNPGNNNGSDPASRVTTTIIEVADVIATKTGPATAVAATNFNYTVTVQNAGPSAAASVVVTDTLPAGATFVSASAGGTLAGGVITWPAIATLASGASQVYTVTVTAPPTGTLLNIVASRSTTLDSDPANNNGSLPAARVTTVVQERADVATTKTGPANVNAAAQFTYTVSTRNNGPSAAAGVVVMDTLPATVTFVSATNGGTRSGNVVTWPAIASLASGASQSYDVTVVAPPTGTFTNIVASTATTPDPVPGNNDGQDPASRVTTSVSELADVATTKAGPARVNANDLVNYTITVSNLGPSDAAGVIVSDPIPAGSTFVTASNGGAVNGNVVQWPAIASLAAGQTLTYTLQVRAPLAGTLTNIVSSTATTTDPNPSNNDGSAPAAHVQTTIEPVDLAVTKTSLPEFRIGTVGLYTLTVRNVGNAPTVGTIIITDTLPAALRYAGADGSGWSCGAAGSIVTCTAPGPLAPGTVAAIQLSVDVLPAAAPSVTNSVAVATLGDTTSGGNNASSIATAVMAQSPLVAEKGASTSAAEVGDVVDYTLTVRNQSAQAVPAVTFNDQLPLGFAYQPGTAKVNGISVPDPAGAPGPALGFPLGTIAGNGTATVTYRVYLGPGSTAGDGLNRAQALSTTTGVASNLATAKVEVSGGVFSDRGIIAGKIFYDCACNPDGVQGPRDIGIPGVRIMLEDGTSTVTDVEGKFNFYGLAPRMHVLKVDVTTLPPGSRLKSISSRNAGDGWTRFVDLRNSEFTRGDFAVVSEDPAVLSAIIARRNAGEIVAAIPDSTPMVLVSDSLATSADTVPGSAYQPLIGGLASPVTAEGAASPVLRLPQANQPERLARPTDSRLEMMVPARGVPADGQTAVPVKVRIAASDGTTITTPATVTLETTLGRWLVEDLDATQPGVQAQLKDGQGEFMLAASPREGVGEVRATSGAMVQTGRVAFLPVERPLTAVGILEGRVDLRSLAKGALVPVTPQDGFEQELKDISISGDSGLDRASARAALYLQGKVKGSYLLTLAFDTERDPGKRYMQDIQPDEFYPVYGDASVKDYGAQSYDRLYVRIDKDRNYFLYGDYQTPSPSQARQLGSYLRSLTGAVQHFENRTVQANAFASLTRITQVVDELPGLGISGPYQLSRGNARINSERIEILTRDRNQPQRVLKVVPLTRFTDYTVEPFTGRILLRQPLPSLDAQLNPVSLRVTYEVELEDAPQEWVYGADAQVRVSSFAEFGGAVVQANDPVNSRQIYTVNGSARLGANTQLVVEGALTNTDSLGDGSAGRFELRHQSGRFSANLFGALSATSFSNPSSTFGAGQLQSGARLAYGIDAKSTVRAEALLSEDRFNGGRRKGALVAYERAISKLFRAEIGYRWAEETAAPVDSATAVTPGATPNETNAIGVKVTGMLPNRRGSASMEFEQDVVNTDQRRAALAAEYWVFPRLRLYGRYELLSSFAGPYALNGAQRLATAVVGFDLAYFRDGQFFSEYRARDAFAGREAEASIGLRNRWQLAPGVRLDASFERVNPIKGGDGSEATAVTAAVEYTRSPLWKGTLRAEYRNATSGDNFLATIGYARKLSRDWTFLGRGFWNALPDDQLRTRGQLGLAWRQTDENKWNGLARYEHGVDRLRNGLDGDLTSRQLDIASAVVNYQPILRFTMSAQYAAKWMRQDDAFLSKTATQLTQLRGIYDLDHNWDVGVQGSVMWGGSFDSRQYGIGGELGRRLINNLRVAAGYNLFGFRDQDLRETDYTIQGGYLRLDFKFDESILPGLKRSEPAP